MLKHVSRFFTSSKTFVKYEQRGKVGLLTLNKPEKLNPLSFNLIADLNSTLKECDSDPNIHVMVVTGAEIEGKKLSAFAAGADIPEMQNNTISFFEFTDVEVGSVFRGDGAFIGRLAATLWVENGFV